MNKNNDKIKKTSKIFLKIYRFEQVEENIFVIWADMHQKQMKKKSFFFLLNKTLNKAVQSREVKKFWIISICMFFADTHNFEWANGQNGCNKYLPLL